MTTAAHRARELLLTLGAVMGVVCIVATLAGVAFGIQPLIFRSGSMSPAIDTGDLALVRTVDARDLDEGDVVSVVNGSGVRVTHRVVALSVAGNDRLLTLQGDANQAADAETYAVTTAARVFFVIPHAGYAVNAAMSPIGVFLGGAFVVALLATGFSRGNPRVSSQDGSTRRARSARASLFRIPLAATMLTGLVVVVAAAPAARAAPWTDAVPVTGSVLTADSVTSQAQPGCTNVDGLLILGNVARLTWLQVNASYEYEWELRRADNNTLVSSGTVGAGVAQGQPVTLDIGTGLIGTNTNYNVVVRARLTSPTSWVAATTTSTPVRRTSIIIIGAAFRCGHA